MKTIYSTSLIIFFAITVAYGQDYGYATANRNTSTSLKTASVSALTTSILANTTRANTKLIHNKNTNRIVYRIDKNVFTQKELFKHFRKAARKSSDSRSFALYFERLEARLSSILTPEEIEQLYTQISQTRFSSRLDRLPSVL